MKNEGKKCCVYNFVRRLSNMDGTLIAAIAKNYFDILRTITEE